MIPTLSPTFNEWLGAVFDHPVRKPEWYWDADFNAYWDSAGVSDELSVSYMARLFEDSRVLERCSLEQVAQGIWFLIGESSPGKSAYALLNHEIALSQRVACVQSMASFFRDFVASVAPGAANEQKDPFHMACYMWWDIFPTYGVSGAAEPELLRACLRTMSEILSIPSDLCRLSALHGLNHWHTHYPEEVEKIVDAFLEKTHGLTNRMIEYAATVRMGGAL